MKNRRAGLVCFLSLGLVSFLFGQTLIERGKEVYELKCGRCHATFAPRKYSFEEWKTVMANMGIQAGLTKEDEELIMAYLQAEAGEEIGKKFLTSPVLAGYIYTDFFSGPAITDTFDLHYLNLTVTGRLNNRTSYRAEFEFEHGGGKNSPPFIEWAYIDFKLRRNTGVKIGAILTPFNRFDDFHGPLENFLVSRPQVSQEIGVSAWKDVGLNFYGSLPVFKNFYLVYDSYVINGLGNGSRLRESRQYRDNNDNKALGFRVNGVYGYRYEAGLSYYNGAWDQDSRHKLTLLGFHFLGKVANLSLYAEYAKATSENPAPLANGRMNGYFFQLSYLFKEKIRSTVRYGTLDYLDRGNLLGRKPADFDTRTVALGLNYYPVATVLLKVEYEFMMEGKRNPKKNNDVLAMQAAIRF